MEEGVSCLPVFLSAPVCLCSKYDSCDVNILYLMKIVSKKKKHSLEFAKWEMGVIGLSTLDIGSCVTFRLLDRI